MEILIAGSRQSNRPVPRQRAGQILRVTERYDTPSRAVGFADISFVHDPLGRRMVSDDSKREGTDSSICGQVDAGGRAGGTVPRGVQWRTRWGN